MLKTYGAVEWDRNLSDYLQTKETLTTMYAAARVMHNIPVILGDGRKIELSPGAHNVLIKQIIETFCAYFTPGADLLYVGDAGAKFSLWEKASLGGLGVAVDEHGKMPDVVVYYRTKKWLVLVEAVTSHGPVSPKRHQELKNLFRSSKAGLVFVTAFLNRKTLNKYLGDIAWETEVWVADAPTHLIHFNGARFLGPYAD